MRRPPTASRSTCGTTMSNRRGTAAGYSLASAALCALLAIHFAVRIDTPDDWMAGLSPYNPRWWVLAAGGGRPGRSWAPRSSGRRGPRSSSWERSCSVFPRRSSSSARLPARPQPSVSHPAEPVILWRSAPC